MEKKNILLILRRLPYPLVSGGDQALLNGILAIKEQMNVVIVYYDVDKSWKRKKEEFEQKVKGVVVSPFNSYHTPSIFQKIKNFLNKLKRKKNVNSVDDSIFLPLFNCEHFTLEYMEYINMLIVRYSINIVQVEMLWLASLSICLPDTVKKIFVHHELGFVRHQLELQTYGRNLLRDSAVQINKMMEIGLLNTYDAVITLSSVDSKKLKRNGVRVPVFDSFAVVKQDEYNSKAKETDPYKLVFVGPQSSPPNVLAINYFLQNCWEKLQSISQRYQLNIIGKWDPEFISAYTKKYPNVNFWGFVESLNSAIHEAIMIVPITVGSGIRMKILEAAQMSVPIVTTTIGVEGIPFFDHHECLIADTPESFVEAITEMQNAELRKAMIDSAKRIVDEKYSLDALQHNRMVIYERICNG